MVGDERRSTLMALNRYLLGALGDVICVEGDCKQGETQVAQMRSTFAELGQPAMYAAAVATINAAYDAAEDSISRKYLPFSTVCCQIKALGLQAGKLTVEMSKAAGVAAPDQAPLEPKAPLEELGDKLSTGAFIIAGAIGVAILMAASGKGAGRAR